MRLERQASVLAWAQRNRWNRRPV